MDRICISENIRTYRKRENISQEKFGAIVGVTGQAISKWENGLSLPDITLLPLIARVLQISLDELILTIV